MKSISSSGSTGGAGGGDSRTVDWVISDIGFGRFQAGVIILCGLIQASDLMEIQYVSMVSQRLQCIWWISDYWKSFITSGTFLGLFVGSCLWGTLGDKHCRRMVTIVCMGYIVVYGCLTALAPNVIWVVILRFLVGTGIGGAQPLSSTVLSEFMPSDRRGLAWFLYQGLWCVGGLVEIGFVWLLLDMAHGWRYLAVITAMPMLLLAIPWLLWLPPSPRQCLLQGRIADTRRTLDRIADANGHPRFSGEFDASDLRGKQKLGSIAALLRQDTYLRSTLQLALIFFAAGFSYYGMILLNVQVPLLLRSRCQIVNATVVMTDRTGGMDRACHSCAGFNYVELLVPTIADMASAVLSALILERLLGRRVIMAVSFCISAVLIPLLSQCMSVAARTTLFFIARFFITTGYNVICLYVVEIYPTTLRATAAGFLASFSRIASILAPFVAQIFVTQVSLLGGLLIFSGMLAAATVSSALLPVETKDQPLAQTAAQTRLQAEETWKLGGDDAGAGQGEPKGADYGSVSSPAKTD